MSIIQAKEPVRILFDTDISSDCVDSDGSLEADAEKGATWTREVQNSKHFMVYPKAPDDELAGLIEDLMVEPPATS